jgi:hypothetical protein
VGGQWLLPGPLNAGLGLARLILRLLLAAVPATHKSEVAKRGFAGNRRSQVEAWERNEFFLIICRRGPNQIQPQVMKDCNSCHKTNSCMSYTPTPHHHLAA